MKIVRRWAQALAALVWGVVLLYFYDSGRLSKYLAEDFRPYTLWGGLALLVLGVFVAVTARQQVGCGHEPGECDANDHEHDHEHSDMPLPVALSCLLAPVLFSVAVTKDSYSAEVLERKMMTSASQAGQRWMRASLPDMTLDDLAKTYARNERGAWEIGLLELFFVTRDQSIMNLLKGQRVRTEGKLLWEQNAAEPRRRAKLYRLFITCCAADARTVPVWLDFPQAGPEVADQSWFAAEGELDFVTQNGQAQVRILVDQGAAIAAPWEENIQRKR